MDLFEEHVMLHLTSNGKAGVFVCPQYSITHGGQEWSCPDFVALDFKERVVFVVEVSIASDVKTLAAKVNDRNKQWFDKLRQQLSVSHVLNGGWKFKVKIFLRDDVRSQFLRQLQDPKDDVEVVTLEQIAFPWKSGQQ